MPPRSRPSRPRGAEAAAERARRRSAAPTEESGRAEAELARCAADPVHFTHNYLVIDDAQDHGDGSGTMPFHLWADQETSLRSLHAERLVVFLKARQLGISWLCLAYALWLMAFHTGKVVLLFSQGEVEAGEMLRRLRVMYERLPDWMLAALPARNRDNTSEQGWANGSWCKSMPATKRAGRSYTASLVILDEAAHQQYGGKLYAALKPTIDAGGKLFVVSSANGADGFFDRLWKKAEAGANNFRPVFLPWMSRPDRDQAWYDRQLAESTDPELIKQEYPGNPIEAFVSSGRTRFSPPWVAAQAANVRDPIDPRSLPDALRAVVGLAVYEAPADPPPVSSRRQLVLSADVAEGLERGDYSAAVLLDCATWEELACLHGRWEPDEYAVKLAVVADAYDATIVVERNNHGHAVLSKLRTLCGWRVADGHDERPGWLTGVLTKPVAIDALAVAMRDGAMTVRTAAAVSEMRDYAVLANGKTSAPPGDHDDLVMAWAIAMGWNQLVGCKVSGIPILTPAPPTRPHPGQVNAPPPMPGRYPGMPGPGRPNFPGSFPGRR